MKPARLFLFTCGIASVTFTARGAGAVTIPTDGRNIYRLAVAELDGQPAAREIVGSTYDDRVCALASDGKYLWDTSSGGFVFDLAAGDLDGDGRDEIAAASADGFVYLYSADGRVRWKHDLGAPVYQVAVARLDGKVPVVLAGGISRQVVAFSADGAKLASTEVNGAVRLLRAGDFDGDGADEAAVLPIRGQPQALHFLSGPQLGVRPADPAASGGAQSGGASKTANGAEADLDGDGASELIYNSAAYTLKGGPRRLFALPGKPNPLRYDFHYNMQLLAVGDLTNDAGAEIVAVEGPQVELFDSAGRRLGQATAPLGFTDVAYLPGSPRGSVILGSSPNGDDNLYRLDFEPGWEAALAGLERRGVMEAIGSNLKRIGDAAAAWQGEPMLGSDGPFDVVVMHYFWSGFDPRKFETWIAKVRDYERQFPYERLRFATAFWPGEQAPLLRPDGQPWGRDRRLAHDLTREQIVAAARHFEAAGCHFWVQVGHGCDPHLEVATVAAMLDAAPRMLLGFISAEDEQPGEVPYYFAHHIKPILELCLKHKKRFIARNKGVWWAHWPADKQMREQIFNGRYRTVLLPCVEDSNSRTPDVNLAARVGLWLDGQVDDWASRCSADWFSFNRAWEWEYPMTGHPQLRYYSSQTLLGARVFMLLNGESRQGTNEWTRVGTEGTATFLHLLGRGAITPPKREQLQSISPVVLALEQPSERFASHGANGHHEEYWGRDGTDGQPWAFDRLDCYWGMAPLPATDVATFLWGRTRRDPTHLPVTTPHGFVALVPGGVSSPNRRWTTVWTTDGDTLLSGGQSNSLAEARTRMLGDLAAGEEQLPFSVAGRLLHQVIEQAPDFYIIALTDPGWLTPAERTATLSTRLPGMWQVSDRLSGQLLGNLASPLKLSVPAGAMRIVEARR